MRPPIAFVYGNCVFAEGVGDAWAAFEVTLSSYAWLDRQEKRARMLAIVGALEAAEADVQFLRSPAAGRSIATETSSTTARSARTSAAVISPLNGRVCAGGRRSTPRSTSSSVCGEPGLDVASYLSRLASRPAGDVWSRVRRAASALDRRTLTADRARAFPRQGRHRGSSPVRFPCGASARGGGTPRTRAA